MNLDINNYPGSKNGSGVKQWIINHIPMFDVFYECCGGSAIITETLALKTDIDGFFYVSEIDEDVFKQLNKKFRHFDNVMVDNIYFASRNCFDVSTEYDKTIKRVVYVDPPYLFETRKSKTDVYNYEWTKNHHELFLTAIKEWSDRGFYIIISHYDCELYRKHLKWWYTSTIKTMTRNGVVEEKIWMNYDITQLNLACTDYVGKDFTERQAIQRKMNRLRKKLDSFTYYEKQYFKKIAKDFI
jgi:DNA adenine methylase